MIGRLLDILDRIIDPGPWNYAGCCGCGRNVVDVFTVRTVNGVEQVSETYCSRCLNRSEILPALDHVALDEALIKVPKRKADRIFADALWRRKAGAR